MVRSLFGGTCVFKFRQKAFQLSTPFIRATLKNFMTLVIFGALLPMTFGPAIAHADQASTVATLRMNGLITGALMPTSSPQFTQMAALIQTGDYYDAAMSAINTPFFAQYLVRRMAKEMQNVSLSDSSVPDNDATTFVVAHLLFGTQAVNTGVNSGISGLWSDNVSCLVTVGGKKVSAFSLTPTQLAAVNWQTQIACSTGQKDASGIPIPASSAGGYMTLSSSLGNASTGLTAFDQSFAQNAFAAGTNLRGVEYLYEISMGLSLAEMALLEGQAPTAVPAFVPESDPNFLNGQNGQAACVSCHGGGASNVLHGYAALADTFNFDTTTGLQVIPSPTPSTQKSLGSNSTTRPQVASCIANRVYPTGFTTCNPDSLGVGSTQSWDLSSWKQGGLLQTMGWSAAAPTSGNGLNALGAAVGKAQLVYQFMTSRVIGEICPLGTLSATTQASIAAAAQANDSFATIVASVAADPACR